MAQQTLAVAHFGDLNPWSWGLVGLGVVQAVVALGVLRGNRLAWWAGDVIAVLDAIAQLGFVPAYPSWSLSVLAIDVLVIYGLSAHGGRALWGLTGARSQWPG